MDRFKQENVLKQLQEANDAFMGSRVFKTERFGKCNLAGLMVYNRIYADYKSDSRNTKLAYDDLQNLYYDIQGQFKGNFALLLELQKQIADFKYKHCREIIDTMHLVSRLDINVWKNLFGHFKNLLLSPNPNNIGLEKVENMRIFDWQAILEHLRIPSHSSICLEEKRYQRSSDPNQHGIWVMASPRHKSMNNYGMAEVIKGWQKVNDYNPLQYDKEELVNLMF